MSNPTILKSKVAIAIDGSYLFKQCDAFGSLARNAAVNGGRFSFSFSGFEKACMEDLGRRGFENCEIVARYFVTSLFQIPVEALQWNNLPQNQISRRALIRLIESQNDRHNLAEAARAAGYETQLYRPTLSAGVMKAVLNKRYAEKRVDSALLVKIMEWGRTEDLHQILVTGDDDVEPALERLSGRYVLAAGRPGHGSPAEWVKRSPFILEDHAREIMGDSISVSCFNCQRSVEYTKSVAAHPTNSCEFCDFFSKTQHNPQLVYPKHHKALRLFRPPTAGELPNRPLSALNLFQSGSSRRLTSA